MANNQVVISRIQNRRGRRENLPQPLLPGELALTSDTEQAWIGGDGDLAVPAVRVYQDKNISNAQAILDTGIVEAIFDGQFGATEFATLVTDLTTSPVPSLTLVAGDIKYDDTFRGEILSITIDAGGAGYTPGDAITAISSSGSGFVGEVATVDGGNGITGITITNGGQNYTVANTSFTVAGGAGADLQVYDGDIHGTTVLIAARSNVDANNTVANIGTALTNVTPAVAAMLVSSGAYPGTIDTGTGVLSVDNQTEAANLATLMNRVNGDTPGEVTGIAHTDLNIEMTGGTNAGATTIPYELGYYFEGIVLTANDQKSMFLFTQTVVFASGANSRAYTNIPATASQVYDLQKNGISFGSVTFGIGANVGTVTIGSSTTFNAGDRLEVFGPAAPDGTLDEVAITLTGALDV